MVIASLAVVRGWCRSNLTTADLVEPVSSALVEKLPILEPHRVGKLLVVCATWVSIVVPCHLRGTVFLCFVHFGAGLREVGCDPASVFVLVFGPILSFRTCYPRVVSSFGIAPMISGTSGSFLGMDWIGRQR